MASLIGRYYGDGPQRQLAADRNRIPGDDRHRSARSLPIPRPIIEATYKQGPRKNIFPRSDSRDDKKIQDGDSLVFFNYREDSIRQIATSFIKKDFKEFPTIQFNDLYIATMTHYDDAFDVPVAFPADNVRKPIGKVLSDAGLTQLRLAETYKYAHVTYFFNGLREPPFPGEYRTLIPSYSKPASPKNIPQMMAEAITDRLIEAIERPRIRFYPRQLCQRRTRSRTPPDYNAALEAIKVIDHADRTRH